MSDPLTAGEPRPFGPAPTPPASGCGRPLLIGCAVLIVAVGGLLLLAAIKSDDLFAWLLSEVEERLTANLPADFTEDDRARLEAAFDAAISAVRSREIDADALQNLQQRLGTIAGKGAGNISRQDLLDLTTALELLGGGSKASGATGAASGTSPVSPGPRRASTGR